MKGTTGHVGTELWRITRIPYKDMRSQVKEQGKKWNSGGNQ